MRRAVLALSCLFLSGCHDLSGNAWIDGPDARVLSEVLGYVFFLGLGIFVALETQRAAKAE